MKWYQLYRRWRKWAYKRQKPRIWAYTGSRDLTESVIIAIRSGRVNRVAIFAGNRVTSNTLKWEETKDTIEVIKKHGVPLILCRFIWQTQPHDHFTSLDRLTEWDFYANEITLLQSEAKELGADYTMLDLEAYGPTPINEHMKAGQESHTEELFQSIHVAVNRAIRMNGQVDFVLPCGSLTRKHHAYEAMAGLGKQRIAEGTYQDRPEINRKLLLGTPYSFDITGMYVGADKGDNADMPLFTAGEVFGDSAYLWKLKDGLFIWPKETHATEVALTL